MNDHLNPLKSLQVEQLLKIIQYQSEQIENQKNQINSLIRSQQSLLESFKTTTVHNNINSNNGHTQSFLNLTQNLTNQSNGLTITDVNSLQNLQSNMAPFALNPSSHSSEIRTPKSNSSCQKSDNSHSLKTYSDKVSIKNEQVVRMKSIRNDNEGVVEVTEISDDEEEIDEAEDVDDDDDGNIEELEEVHNNTNNHHHKEGDQDEQPLDISMSNMTHQNPGVTAAGPHLNLLTDELMQFACKFKRTRTEVGFTQRDVGICLGWIHGRDISQATLSRFEAGNLSRRNMKKLRPLLDKWLDDLSRHGRDAMAIKIAQYYASCQQLGKSSNNAEDESIQLSLPDDSNKSNTHPKQKDCNLPPLSKPQLKPTPPHLSLLTIPNFPSSSSERMSPVFTSPNSHSPNSFNNILTNAFLNFTNKHNLNSPTIHNNNNNNTSSTIATAPITTHTNEPTPNIYQLHKKRKRTDSSIDTDINHTQIDLHHNNKHNNHHI